MNIEVTQYIDGDLVIDYSEEAEIENVSTLSAETSTCEL